MKKIHKLTIYIKTTKGIKRGLLTCWTGIETESRSSMWMLLTLAKRRESSLTKRSGLPEAPMRRVVRLSRSSVSQRRQTSEHASRLALESRCRNISRITSSGRHVLIRSCPRIIKSQMIDWRLMIEFCELWFLRACSDCCLLITLCQSGRLAESAVTSFYGAFNYQQCPYFLS